MSEPAAGSPAPAPVSLGAAARVWLRIGLLGFGGPAGQIALMHRELVERRRWIDDGRFAHALSYCMLLPGPEAQQLATYLGWLLHRTAGGVIAGALFVLPGLALVVALAAVYAAWGQVPAVASGLLGLKAAVLALVGAALVRVGRRVLTGGVSRAIAAAAFVAAASGQVPFPLIVLAAAAAGALLLRGGTGAHAPSTAAGASDDTVVGQLAAAGALAHTRPDRRRALRVLVTCVLLWAAPLALTAALAGTGSALWAQGLFFSQVAVVAFGGAYAILAYVGARAVGLGWLAPGEMVDGLGLAETTPGPLILVVTFVAYLGAHRDPGALSPALAGLLGALLTAWVTFVPSFLWIFLGGPYVEAIRAQRRLGAALAGISAAVVGVMASLALWFALHVLFARTAPVTLGPVTLAAPVWSSAQPLVLALAVGAGLALWRRWPVPLVLALAVAAAALARGLA